MKFAIDVTVEDGKYRYTMTEVGTVTVYRHGELWRRDAQGDGMMMALAAELAEERGKTAAHDARVTELLNHNNDLLERARKAERERDDAVAAQLASAGVWVERTP